MNLCQRGVSLCSELGGRLTLSVHSFSIVWLLILFLGVFYNVKPFLIKICKIFLNSIINRFILPFNRTVRGKTCLGN